MELFPRKKTIFYPGNTLTKYFPEIVQNWKSILSDFGIQYELIEDLNTGWALWDQGYQKEYLEHQQALKERLKQDRVGEVITCSPEAAFMLKTFHPEIKAKHTTELVYENLLKVQPFNSEEACFHDNTTQVRRNNIVQQPREILKKAGFDLKEFDDCKKKTPCLGTSTGLINNSPRLSAKLAMRRAQKAPAKLIITDSPEDYLHFKRSTTANVSEMSEVLVEI